MVNKVLLTALLIILYPGGGLTASAQNTAPNFWITDGPVNAVQSSGSTVYLGGKFNAIGYNTGGGAVVNLSDGLSINSRPSTIKGVVEVSLPDGKGGWYIGGRFSHVGEKPYSNLAHLLPDGTLDESWSPSPNNAVSSACISGTTLYIGGSFTLIAGQSRRSLAAFDLTTGALKNWNPGVDGRVKGMAALGKYLYIGGGFRSVGGITRNKVAAIDTSTALPGSWNPDINPDQPFTRHVNALTVSGNTVYVGGYFDKISAQSRYNAAAIDASTGQLLPWAPTVAGASGDQVYCLQISGTTVYLGGKISFPNTSNAGIVTYHKGLVACQAVTGQPVNPFNAYNTDLGIVRSLCIAGTKLYYGGTHIGALDLATAKADAWRSIPVWTRNSFYTGAEGIYSVSIWHNDMYMGGTFSSAGAHSRWNLASIDAGSRQITGWSTTANSTVNQLEIVNGTLYLAGAFDKVNGQPRSRLAAINLLSGQLTAWNQDSFLDGEVSEYAINGNTLFFIGDFSFVDGQARKGIAAKDLLTGALLPWHPLVEGTTFSRLLLTIEAGADAVYLGGTFLSVNGQPRNRIAALNAGTGALLAWNPDANGSVSAIRLAGSILYMGGTFSQVGASQRRGAAAVHTATGKVTLWNPNASGWVGKLELSGNSVYLGYGFSQINNQSRPDLAHVDATIGQLTSWNPIPSNASTSALHSAGTALFVGGYTNVASINFSVFHLAACARMPDPANLIKGTVFEDLNNNCLQDQNEKGLAQIVVRAEPGPYFGQTDDEGNYSLAVDTGTYQVTTLLSLDKSRLLQQVCPGSNSPHSVTFTGYQAQVLNKNFGNRSTDVPYLTAQVASTRRRRCFAGSTTITYCNPGGTSVPDAKVYLKLPEYVVLLTASMPYTVDKDGNYVFSIGSLDANRCGKIQVKDSVVCGSLNITGLTQCTKAWITPANVRIPDPQWDQASINLKARCLANGKVELGLYNTGAGNMADSSTFRIYLDAQLAFRRQYKIAKGDSLVFQLTAGGKTVRLEADQTRFHPSRRQTTVSIEACGISGESTVNGGYVNQQEQEEEEPEIATECLPVTNSYDPNDKAVSPNGTTAEHYTPTAAVLKYVVRFQNTGNDTAYKVVIADTLSEYLDLHTLQIGAVSHPYQARLEGKGKAVLTFLFDNINLPDSTADREGSNGFIQFSIQPKAGLPQKTRVENTAGIFFDYNEPIITNATVNTLYDVPIEEVVPARAGDLVSCTPVHTVAHAGASRALCEQDTVQLTATPAIHGKGHWKQVSGRGFISDKESAAATVTGLAYGENVFEWSIPASYCGTDSLRAQVKITRYSKPRTPYIIPSGADSLVCNASGGSYEWYLNSIALESNTQIIKTNQPGSYQVRVKDLQGCISDLSEPFAYVLTGTEASPEASVSLYPNPNTGKFTLSVPRSAGPLLEAEIRDALGRVIVTCRGPGSDESGQIRYFDLTQEKRGIYIISIRTTKGVMHQKISIK